TFEPTMHAALLSRLELQADLQDALAKNQLVLAYQPVYTLDTRAFVGAEALLRWIHPTHGLIPPNVFIPIAEQSGLIVPIGLWALTHACEDAARWVGDADKLPWLSVNVSGRQ